jgi:hypothetical protein
MEMGESRYGHGDILAVPGLCKDGSRIPLKFTILPMRAENGRMEDILAILRDVTGRFEEIRALKREIAVLRSSSAAQRGETTRNVTPGRTRTHSIVAPLQGDGPILRPVSGQPARRREA